MSTCYEFALTCDLKDDVSQAAVDALTYMTRSEQEHSTNFETDLKHPLFTSSKDVIFEGDYYLADWKLIISSDPSEGEELLPGKFGSIFQNRKLSIRKFVGDDEFTNTFYLLVDWLASVCKSDGFVGYYFELRNLDRRADPVLIYFENGRVFEKHVDGELRQLLA
jgi:hypothetical protein